LPKVEGGGMPRWNREGMPWEARLCVRERGTD
jgi:hypothetical protein